MSAPSVAMNSSIGKGYLGRLTIRLKSEFAKQSTPTWMGKYAGMVGQASARSVRASFLVRIGLKPHTNPYEMMCERYGLELAWNQSRLFFGLIVKDVMIHRPDEHRLCYKIPEDEIEKGTNYFPDFS